VLELWGPLLIKARKVGEVEAVSPTKWAGRPRGSLGGH
jgi:hypothetical protein